MAIASVLLALAGSPGAAAHGKEISIGVACMAPDPGRPLTKVCTALLRYADGDPVTGANAQLTAVREGREAAPLGPVPFKPLDQEGAYTAAVTFPAYGQWRMRFQVLEPERGEAEVREELLPPLPGATPEIRARLQIVFDFGWSDVQNIAVRTVHLLAAGTWFALVALVLVLSRLAASAQQRHLLGRVAAAFPWAATATLLLLTSSGIYTGRYGAPTRPPGIFAPEAIARLPFGEAYVVAFFIKMGLMLAIVGATAALALALRRAYHRPAPTLAGAGEGAGRASCARQRQVTWLAALNLVLGAVTFASVVVLGYLHIIGHVAAAAGGR